MSQVIKILFNNRNGGIMKKIIKKNILLCLISISFIFSLARDAVAVEFYNEKYSVIKDSLLSELNTYKQMGVPYKITENDKYKIYEIEVRDKNMLKKLDLPDINSLVSSTQTYLIPKSKIEYENINSNHDINKKYDFDTVSSATVSPEIRNWKYIGNKYYNKSRGVPYSIEGPINFNLLAETISYWETSSNLELGLRKKVELKLGGKIGRRNKKQWSINVKIPKGYRREITVWEFQNKYNFDVYFVNNYLNSYSAYKPNGGLKISNNLYKK